MVDRLADTLNTLKTHEMVGQRTCTVKATKLVREVLELLKTNDYLGGYEFVDDGRGGYFNIQLDGRINDCGVINPRLAVKRHEWAKLEQRFIPGVGVGLLIVTTSKGVMTNHEADGAHIGGRLLAYVY